MKIALIRGPHLRPNGVLPWEHLHNNYEEFEITAFQSKPKRFDASSLDMPVKQLHWLDGKFNLFGYEHMPSKGISHLGYPSKALWGFRKLSKEYDVIHTSENFNFFSLQGAVWSKLRKDTKSVFSAGENIPYPPNQRRYFTRKTKEFVNSMADGITTTTYQGKKALIHEKADPDKIKVVPNALKFEKFERADVNASELEMDEELDETFNVLFVHGLKQQKGVPYLIEAFEELSKRHDDIRLILVGKNHFEAEYCTNKVANNDQIYHFEYIPNSEISDLYNLSDMFILPSITMQNNEEQFGMAILEAMACGLPTVVTRVGGMPYVVSEGETSLVIEEKSAKEIEKSISRLYNQPELRDKLGEEGYRYVRKAYSKSEIGEHLKEFYRDLE